MNSGSSNEIIYKILNVTVQTRTVHKLHLLHNLRTFPATLPLWRMKHELGIAVSYSDTNLFT